jgi:hypothetical protein
MKKPENIMRGRIIGGAATSVILRSEKTEAMKIPRPLPALAVSTTTEAKIKNFSAPVDTYVSW